MHQFVMHLGNTAIQLVVCILDGNEGTPCFAVHLFRFVHAEPRYIVNMTHIKKTQTKGYGCVHSSSVHIRCRAAEIRQLIGHGCCDAILHNSVDALKRS